MRDVKTAIGIMVFVVFVAVCLANLSRRENARRLETAKQKYETMLAECETEQSRWRCEAELWRFKP